MAVPVVVARPWLCRLRVTVAVPVVETVGPVGPKVASFRHTARSQRPMQRDAVPSTHKKQATSAQNGKPVAIGGRKWGPFATRSTSYTRNGFLPLIPGQPQLLSALGATPSVAPYGRSPRWPTNQPATP